VTYKDPNRNKDYNRAYYRQHPELKVAARTRYYTPKAKTARRKYLQRPDVKKARVEWQRRYMLRHPEKKVAVRISRREYCRRPDIKAKRRAKQSGITAQMFAELMLLQGGHCGCCGRVLTAPQADHCHTTKKPRGLLCADCNTIEGKIKKLGCSPVDFGQRLQKYLDSPPVQSLGIV